MKQRSIYAIIILLIAIGSVSSLFAQKGMGMLRGHAQTPAYGKSCDRIPDLTDAQRTKIEDLRLKFQEEQAPQRIKMQKMRLELQELLIAKNPNTKAIDTKIEELGKMRTEMQKKRVGQRLAIRSLLTDKQKVMFDMFPNRKGGFGKHHGGRRGMCAPGNRW